MGGWIMLLPLFWTVPLLTSIGSWFLLVDGPDVVMTGIGRLYGVGFGLEDVLELVTGLGLAELV